MAEQIKQITGIIFTNKKTNNYIKLAVGPEVIPKYKTNYSAFMLFKKILLLMIISFIIGFLVFLISKANNLSFELKKLSEEKQKINKFSYNYKVKIINLLKMRKISQKLNNILMNFLSDMKS